tara:strand:- start:161 stop:376 length:216 start_codon:yes stop_codon:yes gene_type:complete
MRVLIEILYIVAGLGAAMLLGWLSAWSYPRAHHDIWLVTGVSMVIVVALGMGSLVRAFRADRATLSNEGGR